MVKMIFVQEGAPLSPADKPAAAAVAKDLDDSRGTVKTVQTVESQEDETEMAPQPQEDGDGDGDRDSFDGFLELIGGGPSVEGAPPASDADDRAPPSRPAIVICEEDSDLDPAADDEVAYIDMCLRRDSTPAQESIDVSDDPHSAPIEREEAEAADEVRSEEEECHTMVQDHQEQEPEPARCEESPTHLAEEGNHEPASDDVQELVKAEADPADAENHADAVVQEPHSGDAQLSQEERRSEDSIDVNKHHDHEDSVAQIDESISEEEVHADAEAQDQGDGAEQPKEDEVLDKGSTEGKDCLHLEMEVEDPQYSADPFKQPVQEEDPQSDDFVMPQRNMKFGKLKDSVEVQKHHKANDDEVHEENPHLQDYLIPHHSFHISSAPSFAKVAKDLQAEGILHEAAEECPQGKTAPKRKVHFGTVLVRDYDMILGDHPCCSYGPPLTIDWDYLEYEPLDIDEYEFHHPPRRCLREMMMNYYQRKGVLSKAGFTDLDFKASKKAMNKVKLGRSVTRQVATNTSLFKTEAAVESAVRKFKRLIKDDHWKKQKSVYASSRSLTV
ncbi:hypothetical protein ACHAWF_004203 [Thalassiosira exigua]